MSDVELLHFSEENLHTGEGARVLHQCGVPATYKIHTHDFYELFLVPKGSAVPGPVAVIRLPSTKTSLPAW